MRRTKTLRLQNGKTEILADERGENGDGDYFSLKAQIAAFERAFVNRNRRETNRSPDFLNGVWDAKSSNARLIRLSPEFTREIPENLSVKAAFPRLYELEKDYGSLCNRLAASQKPSKPTGFSAHVFMKNGVQTLTAKLAEQLGESIVTNVEVTRIEKNIEPKMAHKD
jgi:hypothetical protein